MKKIMSLCLFMSLGWPLSLALALSQTSEVKLHDNWHIQDSAVVTVGPADLSAPGFPMISWYSAVVPSTVLGALVSLPGAQDPFFGMNLKGLPGSGDYYVWGKNFGLVQTPEDSPFGRPWYYRLEFQSPRESLAAGAVTELQFLGVTYGAHVWLNGHEIATQTQTLGSYRKFKWDVTPFLNTDSRQSNVLLVLVGNPQPLDLTPSWVDWNPTPQDKNMGLYRDVSLLIHGSVSLSNPQVVTETLASDYSSADLSVEVDAKNFSNQPVNVTLQGEISQGRSRFGFTKDLTLAAQESRTVRVQASEAPNLHVQNPDLWWPAQMGSPTIYQLHLTAINQGQVYDQSTLAFGIRKSTSEITSAGARLFKINGRPIQIRGGGWSSDLFLRFSADRARQEIQYVKDLGLNTIRLEGRFEPDEFLQMTDQEGVLVMAGWVCCNAWQTPDQWPVQNQDVAVQSLRDQIYQMRAHPSVFTFLYGSDEAPPEQIEKIYVDTFSQFHWPNPIVASAAKTNTPLNGDSGFKMFGPYEYEPPSYWYLDTKHGGAYGFNTETSPGPSIPPLESLKAFIPANHLWPIDKYWTFHAGENDFDNIQSFQSALNLRYGESQSVEEFAMKAQVMGYDNHRAMFEAFGKNKYRSATGIIQWMLNNAWPSLIWHLYDTSLRPGGSYYGVKKSNQPLHLQYSYDDQSIFLVNHTQGPARGLSAHLQVFNRRLQALVDSTIPCEVGADQGHAIAQLPNLEIENHLYYVRLELQNSSGQVIDNNFYWLSDQQEDYDWDNADWKQTPIIQESDLTELNRLGPAQVQASIRWNLDARTGLLSLKNVGANLAFFLQSRVVCNSTGQEMLPVLWQDNYVSLLPNESRDLTVSYSGSCSSELSVEVMGWNLAAIKAGLAR
jgi:exo-1,4-beta-D-glucosaminidase